MHMLHMVIDLQYGSTGKGLLAGYLAKREAYDTVVCAFAPNAGHTYIDKSRGINMMTQQLPTGICSPTVKNVLLGPGSLIHVPTLEAELEKYQEFLVGKRILIHPHAAIVEEYHIDAEREMGMSKIGSTTKGVGAAAMQRISRDPALMNVAFMNQRLVDRELVTTPDEYAATLQLSQNVLVEGAQGFGLSIYHGFYPYTTSRDVTPWQIAADCGLPYRWAPYVKVFGTLRTFPIRVNNRDGTSGPGYPDQQEIGWTDLPVDVDPELTTVTKLPRRIFTFSEMQLAEAAWHCGAYWDTKIFLNFANYMPDLVTDLVGVIEKPTVQNPNPPKVAWLGYGPDDSDVVARVHNPQMPYMGGTHGR